MKVFVTGGTGNIGQYVTKTLLDAGHGVVLLTRTPERVPAFAQLPGVTIAQGNLLDLDGMGRALKGCDAVIHIALGWGNDPVEMLNNDTRATAYLMDAAEKAGVGSFVYTSSTAAMGDMFDGIDETAVCRPTDLYGATKAASEAFLLGFNRYYGGQGSYDGQVKLRRNIIRPGYTFSTPAFPGGASQSDKRFLDIALSVLKDEELSFSPQDGTQFLSSRQIAQLYLKLVESDLNREVFLALGSRFISWLEIARMTLALVPTSRCRITASGEDGEKSLYCVDKMKRVFGLNFDGMDDLEEHILWNLDRARRIIAGESVYDPYHVW